MANAGEGFPHLPWPLHVTGLAKFNGRGKSDPRTAANKKNPARHASLITQEFRTGVEQRKRITEERPADSPTLPAGAPFLLRVEPDSELDWLITSLDLEIVAEESDGYVLVAAEDLQLTKVWEVLNKLASLQRGGGQAAKLYGVESESERLKRILSDSLWAQWPTLKDDELYIVDIGIECIGKHRVPEARKREDYKTEERYKAAVERWKRDREDAELKWDELQLERQNQLERFLRECGGKAHQLREGFRKSEFHLPDSTEARIELTGKHLRDFVLNYPFLFEVSEPPELATLSSGTATDSIPDDVLTLLPPTDAASTVGVIDSGIQEEHRLLKAAMDQESVSLVPGEEGIFADYVRPGGHGTRVAGAVVYGEVIPEQGAFKPPVWVQNIRVLNRDNRLPENIHPAAILQRIVETCEYTSIFNHSINASHPCRLKHMSAWAAAMDLLSFEQDILFVQSAGNIAISDTWAVSLGIENHLNAGRDYPTYLTEASCRVASPAESLQAITVGSIAYKPSTSNFFAEQDEASCFSRTGFGIWGTLKPDVVEYGGDFTHDGNQPPRIKVDEQSCPMLVRSTLHGGPAQARDTVGTSFAAPKVARLAGEIQNALPDQPCLLYRALIANSARWPMWAEARADTSALRRVGYGIPNRERALFNSPYRVTLITAGTPEIGPGEGHIYQIPIPSSLRRADMSNRIRVDVTLSYAAQPRRTRRTIKRYLATWLSWDVSKAGETVDSFQARVLKEQEETLPDGDDIFDWALRENKKWGKVKGTQRHLSTLQKDWALLEAHQLPESFCLGVAAHNGWSKDPLNKAKYSLVVSFEAIDGDLEIYNLIRAEVEQLRERVRV